MSKDEVQSAIVVGAGISYVAGNERGVEVGADNDGVPFSQHRIVVGEARAADSWGRFGGHSCADGADEG